MSPYYLKCRQKAESKDPSVMKAKKTTGKWWCYQTVSFAIVKNQDLSKSKKLMGY